ncbi:OmpH family outer membrane protein [Hephaestia sp. GCM10023244]|uniref:OmpH family outer membrane protein n=1 Tax=unclassified Hephaestia TaxID=2631281 RepID=UPI0020773EE3|nr:OmpH family outer membrane protein [Hephaestia sp. MAHUQ-44]MCM8731437.1 OmpH family outer membrane protein [Hephaestia sp. MAHUQ-44]
MINLKTFLAAAALTAPALAIGGTAHAQVAGIAVADPEAAVANTKAWATAKQQIETTYKAQLDQAEARRQAIATELKPLYDAFNAARSAATPNEAALTTQAQTIRQREEAGKQELARLQQPAARAQGYALEQISTHLDKAVQTVVGQKNVSLLLRPESAFFAQPAVDITPAITAELDRVVPSVSISPPATWQPGQQHQQAAPAAAAPAQTQGR